MTANLIGAMRGWDPYPFNVALSFQAAYAAPVIMMSSQNRQQDIDCEAAENDYRIVTRLPTTSIARLPMRSARPPAVREPTAMMAENGRNAALAAAAE